LLRRRSGEYVVHKVRRVLTAVLQQCIPTMMAQLSKPREYKKVRGLKRSRGVKLTVSLFFQAVITLGEQLIPPTFPRR
jgi:hypothetical protein